MRSVQENIVTEVVGERRPRSISFDRRQLTMTVGYKRISVLFATVAETGRRVADDRQNSTVRLMMSAQLNDDAKRSTAKFHTDSSGNGTEHLTEYRRRIR
jgi:hypothetical protein